MLVLRDLLGMETKDVEVPRSMKIFCWLFRHKLSRINSSPDGALEKLLCLRCSQCFAMYHPLQYFEVWDWDDEKYLRGRLCLDEGGV